MKWAPTSNAFSTTLNGAINSTATTITLNSVTGLQNKAGILVIDRVNSAGTSTPSSREYIYFTGVSGSSVTLPSAADGRGQGGSTGQSHADGAVVEAIMDVDAWNGLMDSYDVQHNDAGTHNALTTDTFSATSLVSISSSLFVAGQGNFPSTVSINQSAIGQTIISTRLRAPVGVSGASLSGEIAVDTTQNNLLVGTGTIGAKLGIGAWQSYTPTFTGFSVDPTGYFRYQIIGRVVILTHYLTANGTSSTTAYTATLPVTAVATPNYVTLVAASVVDNGVQLTTFGRVTIAAAATTLTVGMNAAGGGWVASGAKGANFTIIYEI